MEEKQTMNTSLMSSYTEDIEEVPIVTNKCCSCCSSCCGTKKKEQSSNNAVDDPFRILTNLWAHKDVIKDLEEIRLNPNLLNENQIRYDLEFYIPQLCTFMIFGEYEIVEEFLAFLCKACFASFFFAHRVIWFLKSILDTKASYNEKIMDILLLLQSIFKSEFDKNVIERFHIASSSEFVDFLSKTDSLFIYNFSNDLSELRNEQLALLEKKKKIREEIDNFSEKHYEYTIEKVENIKDRQPFTCTCKVSTEDIFLNIFKEQKLDIKSLDINIERFEQIDEDDINLISFASNIHFVDHLCNICELIKLTPPDKQLEDLQKELMLINKNLPSNNYIPFIKDSVRNYVIAHIPVSEARIFRTKNRAPYCITLEIFRIDELNFVYSEKVDKMNIRSHPDKNFLDSNKIIMQTIIEKNINKKRSNSFSDLDHSSRSINSSSDDITLLKKVDSKYSKNNDKNGSKKNEVRKRKQTIMFINESDVKLSKPVLINKFVNLTSKKKRKSLEGNKEDIIIEDIKIVKMDDFIKNRRTTIMPLANKKSNLKLDKSEKKGAFNEKDEINFFKSQNDSREDEIKGRGFTSLVNMRGSSFCEKKVKNKIFKIDVEDEEEPIEEVFNKSISDNKHDPYFGELLVDQTERLRSLSPFGHLATWKIFKMIVKSGEDLRQEQFATQLINEFYQIFKLEKVDCWVNTYEIISTGNNIGLIECIPNSISIDQLKRKSKIATLNEFYEKYYGPVNSERYKTAITNFLRSLAGYSLVCYFLQIKDRHNGNIMIDNEGHIIHIDFGFMLSNAPGKGIKFENAPFKLTSDFVDVMGGVNSSYFTKFRKLVWKGFLAIVKHSSKITTLVEMMFCGHGFNLPCFERGEAAIENLKLRFHPRPDMKAHDYLQHVDKLIEYSIDNWRTKWYDKFQYYVQGIFY